MKRYAILTVVVLAVLTVAWTAFGQEEEKTEQRQQWENLRQRFENMSEEEREEFRTRMRERFVRGLFVSPEENEEAIKVIEEQLAILKAAQVPQFEGKFEDLSKEEQTKLSQKRWKITRDRLQAIQATTEQVARLQGRSKLEGEGEKYIIVSTVQLKQIQESATKEKAKETSQLLERLIARESRGFGGRRRGWHRPQSDQEQ